MADARAILDELYARKAIIEAGLKALENKGKEPYEVTTADLQMAEEKVAKRHLINEAAWVDEMIDITIQS